MLTPAQWDAALHPAVHWKNAYETVAREARAYLVDRGISYNMPLSTSELVDSLYPAVLGGNWSTRKRMFGAFKVLGDFALQDCAHRGPARSLGKTSTQIRPWLWHAPLPGLAEPHGPRCPHCGGVLS